jgi:hypothetical protein
MKKRGLSPAYGTLARDDRLARDGTGRVIWLGDD